jgi:multidrug resistance efflux pump
VRLAQRIPVRIAFDEVPADFRMIAGRTATVSIIDDKTRSPRNEQGPDDRRVGPDAVGLSDGRAGLSPAR